MAIALSTFLIVLGMVLYCLAAAADQVRCLDAAREAARQAARGEPEQARNAAARIAPAGAQITISTQGAHIHVDVRAAPAGGVLPGMRLHAQAFAVREPTE
ncbi:MAG TPA: TadE family type IV pilus minor pilin [Actinophytocola sp.]